VRRSAKLSSVAVCACAVLEGVSSAQPSPRADRVGFPKGYEQQFEKLRTMSANERLQVGTVYANKAAASPTSLDALPYPNGSIIVMEWRAARKDAAGKPLLDPNGGFQQGDVVRFDVMRREAGWGAAYGADRAGEWEFASYGPAGAALDPPADPAACARCHKQAAARDFVFRGRFPEQERRLALTRR
jgi:hypothetical protein